MLALHPDEMNTASPVADSPILPDGRTSLVAVGDGQERYAGEVRGKKGKKGKKHGPGGKGR